MKDIFPGQLRRWKETVTSSAVKGDVFLVIEQVRPRRSSATAAWSILCPGGRRGGVGERTLREHTEVIDG